MVNKGTSKVINKRTSPPRLNKSAKSLNKLPLRSSVRTVGGRRRAAIIDELIKTTENKNIEKIKDEVEDLSDSFKDAIDTGKKIKKASSSKKVDYDKIDKLDKELGDDVKAINKQTNNILKHAVAEISSSKKGLTDAQIKNILDTNSPEEMISIIDDLEKRIKDAYKERIGILEKTYEQVIAIGIIAKHDTDTFKANIDKTKAQLETALNEISQVKTALSESPEDIIGGRRYRNKTGSDKPDKLDKPDTPDTLDIYLLETL
jgi:membrane-associated HD superfamily phosphohydrolase